MNSIYLKKGFSLIELMVVIVILGLLATFLLPKIINRPDEARVTKALTDIKTIESALKMYKLDNGIYPTVEQGLLSLIKKPSSEPLPKNWKKGGYIDSSDVPLDPWGKVYIYRSPGDNERDYEIISYGSDGKEGGEDTASDIKSYEIK